MVLPAPLIVVGNEKGGSGKTTVAIHLVAGLIDAGLRPGAIDLDHRQQSLSHFFANRVAWAERCAAQDAGAGSVALILASHWMESRQNLLQLWLDLASAPELIDGNVRSALNEALRAEFSRAEKPH